MSGIDTARSLRQARAARRCNSLRAINGINTLFLETLCARAKAPQKFPLGDQFKTRFAGLTENDRRTMSSWGMCLMDAGFSDHARWAAIQERISASNPLQSFKPTDHSEANPLGEDGRALAQALYLVAWSLVQWNADEAVVLLGMSRDTARVFRQMEIDQLTHVARVCNHWVTPRFSELQLAWTDLLNSPSVRAEYDEVWGSAYGTLRLLGLNGGSSLTIGRFVNGAAC